MLDAKTIKAGTVLLYNDGRPGHINAKATVLEVEGRSMRIQFDDRASSSTVFFDDPKWMDHLTIDPKTLHYFVNSNPSGFDSDCSICEGKHRDAIHRTSNRKAKTVNSETKQQCEACGVEFEFDRGNRYKNENGDQCDICQDCITEYQSQKCVELDASELMPDAFFELRDWVDAEARKARPETHTKQPHSEMREWLLDLPLQPWADHSKGIQSATGVQIFRLNPCGDMKLREAEAANAYAVHCANVLPVLLAAVEAFEQEVKANVPGAASASVEVRNALHDAIAEAHGGDIRARMTQGATPATINADLLDACKRLIALGKAGADTSWQSEAPGVPDTFYRMMCAIRDASLVRP